MKPSVTLPQVSFRWRCCGQCRAFPPWPSFSEKTYQKLSNLADGAFELLERIRQQFEQALPIGISLAIA